MDDDDEQIQREEEQREDNILSKTNLNSQFKKLEKAPKWLLGTTATIKLSNALKVQQEMNKDVNGNKVKYRLTYTHDKQIKTVLKFQDNKTLGGSFTVKKEGLQSKWKLFGEVTSDGKREFEVNWKRNLLKKALRLEVNNKIRVDRDYEHSIDLKAVYQIKLRDVSSFVKVKSKNLQIPEVSLDSKFVLGWDTAIFSEIVCKNWQPYRYTIQAERKEYMAEFSIEYLSTVNGRENKRVLVLARDLKPCSIRAKLGVQNGRYIWELLTRMKFENRNQFALSISSSRVALQLKANPLKNVDMKLSFYVICSNIQNNYTYPLDWARNVPVSLTLKLNG